MSRRLVGAGLAAIAAAGAVAAAIVLGAGSDGRRAPSAPPLGGEPVAFATTVSPPVHRLGDLVTARLEVAIDTGVVDPDLVKVRAQFAPYEVAGDIDTSLARGGGLALLSLTYPLQCVESGCISEDQVTRITLPQPVVSYVRSDTGAGVDARPAWPELTLVARAGDGTGSVPAEATVGELPEPTYAIDPTVLRWLAISVASLLLAVVGAWLVWAIRPALRRDRAVIETADESAPLTPVLARLREVRDGPGPARRAALEQLARGLEGTNGGVLAEEARRVAWSRADPDPAEIDTIAAAVDELELEP